MATAARPIRLPTHATARVCAIQMRRADSGRASWKARERTRTRPKARKIAAPTHGTMVWDGIVKDNAIEATSTWTRERWYWKIKREYWYRGQLKK